MSRTSVLLDFLSNNIVAAVVIGVNTVVVYYVSKFYWNRRKFPAGPFPLPFIGNIYMLKGSKKHFHQDLEDYGKKYSGFYTFYLGPLGPHVIVTDPKIGLEVLRKHQFAGRPYIPGLDVAFVTKDSIDIALGDFGKEWEALRKVAHSAVRKYAVSDKLANVVSLVVDEVVGKIKNQMKNGEQEIDIKRLLYLGIFSILSSSAFGKNYSFEDEELLKWIDVMEEKHRNQYIKLLIMTAPFLKYVFRKTHKRAAEGMKYHHEYTISKFEEHVRTFDGENIRDFTDAMLAAKKEAEIENQEDGSKEDLVKYLKDANLQNAVLDLFVAGSDTSIGILSWIFLLLANFPQSQKLVREEIMENIGEDEVPSIDHRQNCPYTCAFISEVFRFRTIAPVTLMHKATVDIDLNGFPIKKDTNFIVLLTSALNDKDTWGDPDVFRPERFLDKNGKFNPRPNAFFIPFSAGRRACPGEKLALADIFFFVSRFIQRTSEFEISLPKGPGTADLSGDLNEAQGWAPHPYKIVLKGR